MEQVETNKETKINFTNVKVETEIGKFETKDISKQIGNYIHLMTDDIGMDDIAHEIYRNGCAVLNKNEIETIKKWIKQATLPPFIRLAILRDIDNQVQQINNKE